MVRTKSYRPIQSPSNWIPKKVTGKWKINLLHRGRDWNWLGWHWWCLSLEKTLATWIQILTLVAFRLWCIWISCKSIRSQKQIACSSKDNSFKKVTHATRLERNKHSDESKVKGHWKLKEHSQNQGFYCFQKTHLYHHRVAEYKFIWAFVVK